MNELTITRWKNLVDPVGVAWSMSWPELACWLSERRDYLGDKTHPGWSAAEFDPCRRGLENVRRVFALCLDYDGGETIDAVRERLDEFCGLLHTTRKHTPDAPRFRVVLPLSRPVSPFEYQALWVRFAAFAGNVDQAPKDPSRFWFVPGCAPDGEFLAEELTGAFLDPDEWLAKPEPAAPRPAPEPARQAERHRPDVEERAIKYLARMPASISGQGGDRALWDAAVMMAKGFGLSESATLRILRSEFNPRCEPPWPDSRLVHKAKQAARANLPDGFKLDTDREWQPRNSIPDPKPLADDGPWDYPDMPEGEPEPEPEAAPEPTKTAVERYGVISLRQMFHAVYEEAKSGEKKMGFTTGIDQLDKLIGGLREEHVTLIGAGTSWGKSTMGIMVADENDLRDVPILIVSGEDARVMYGKRLAARRGKINALRLRDNDLDREDLDELIRLSSTASPRPVFLDAIGKPVEWICKAIRELSKELGIRLVIADYVQRFKAERRLQDRRNTVTYVAERLSDEIKLAGAAGVLLSQLKRIEGRKPTMDDLKESGDLENMAEHVLLGYREKAENQWGDDEDREQFVRYITVAKNKDGPVSDDDIVVPFDGVTASFGSNVEFPRLKWK